jgi:hypothetical protein
VQHSLHCKLSSAIAILAVCCFTRPARAVLVVDQSQVQANNSYSSLSRFTFQQSVTAGMSGKLAGFALVSNQVGAASVYINVGPAWQFDAPNWSGTMTSTGPGFDFVDVSAANIMLNSGDQFVIGFNGANVLGVQGVFLPQPSDAYVGGGVYTHDSVPNTIAGPFLVIGSTVYNTDLTFLTYIDVAAVPEASPLLIWTGIATVAGCIYVRRMALPKKVRPTTRICASKVR